MEEEKNKINIPKKNLIIAITGIALVIILGGGYYLYARKLSHKPADKSLQSEKKSDDLQVIKDANKDVISEAENFATENVKPISDKDFYQGNLNAPVQIIVYNDFDCPFSADFYDVTKKIMADYKDQVAIAVRNFPLSTHKMAVPAAITALCANEQGKFWEMHDKLFADYKTGMLAEEQFKKDAADLKLDTAKFDLCQVDQKYLDEIENNIKEAKKYGVAGTPTVFVNGEILPGAYPFEDFTGSDGKPAKGMKSIIEEKLNKTKI